MLNSDYVWDMVFYPSGAIEDKFHATGYISSAFLFVAAQRRRNQVGEYTLGTIHTHSAHYKDWRTGSGLRTWLLSPRRYPEALSTRYQLAVTQRKETEPSSSSVFNQNDPWTPTVDFADFINNETIAGKDLVAWVTAAFLHIPHAEDIPNTVTVGNGVGFFLRPYNFFDLDPSINSADSIYFQKDQDAGSY
ncbi:hypothetical protein MJG53_015382 [Ovis ammon polii x Ovis aries]|uniref:Uncharacterized protein n=1 Tax=Ovis ammon polii x Ovis aries TaxID=2918886 RepID=A0ACB9UEK1_9CETA|nr:hypothetical protein MJG53_015382 [Ovis ammon polii x Ovis aries]